MGERTPAYSETVSDPAVLRRARLLRGVGLILEGLLWLIVAGSVLAIGSVHPWAYVPLWCACLVAGVVLAVRAAFAGSLRRKLGRRPFAFHLSGRWLVVEPSAAYPDQGWGFDLRRPLLPRAPLLLPGAAFILWILFQMIPLPPAGVTITQSIADTRRGLAFVASLLVLHLAAAAALERREPRERFRRFVAGLGLFLGLQALVQLASGTTRIYGVFTPLERGAIFGPFVNRNHFAGYMLMVAFVAFGLLTRYWRRYHRRVGERPNLRRRLVALSTAEGTRVLYAAVPAVAAVAALVATTSRGALLAFAAGLILAGLGLRRRQGVPGWGLAVAFVVMAVSWFGLERLGVRFNETARLSAGCSPGA